MRVRFGRGKSHNAKTCIQQCVLCPIKDDQEMRIPSTRNVHDLVSWAHQFVSLFDKNRNGITPSFLSRLCAVWHPQLSVVDQQVVGLGQSEFLIISTELPALTSTRQIRCRA